MNFKKDIKQFTEVGNYEPTVGLKYLEKTLKEFEEDCGLELNPDFQRGNVWTEEQQIAYLEFYLRGGKTARVIYFNCPFFVKGSLKDYRNGKYEMPMVCVDGLQRLTALLKMIRGEIKVFGIYIQEFEDYDILMRGLNIRININNLQTKKEVLQWYLDFNQGGTVHSDEELIRVRKMLEECK
jgi:uncharacterized protein with ParB-like and HNH nuclease domain